LFRFDDETLNRLLPMVKNSTFIYLLDDFSNPPDMILTPFYDETSNDDLLNACLNMVECDPGEKIVESILLKAAIETKPLQ